MTTSTTRPNPASVPVDSTSADPAIALHRGRDRLVDMQHDDGYWVGELEGDSILESEYLLVRFILGHDDDPDKPEESAVTYNVSVHKRDFETNRTRLKSNEQIPRPLAVKLDW